MVQAAALSINDGTTPTPVAITFSPEKISPELSVFVDRRKTARALQPSLTIGLKPPVGGRTTYRAYVDFDYPIEGVKDGIAAAVAVARYKDGDFIIPDVMPLADRRHFRAFVANSLDNATVKAMIEDLDPAY